MPRHMFRGARETRATLAAPDPRLRYSATYHDAWISHPERLGMELILDAQRLAPDTIALNYAEMRPDGDRLRSPRSADRRAHSRDGAAVVNATGAWLDETNRRSLHGAAMPTSPLSPAPRDRT